MIINQTLLSENINELQIVSLSALVIVGVMSWGDFHCTSTKLNFDEIIRNYFHFAIRDEWVNKLLANQLFISFVLWVYCNCDITQHCLNSCCSNYDLFGWIFLQFVSEVYQNTKLYLFFIARDRYKCCFL